MLLLMIGGCGVYDLLQIVVEPDPDRESTADTGEGTELEPRSRARCEAGAQAACDCLESKYASGWYCVPAYVAQTIEDCVNREADADWVDCMADYADLIEAQLLASPYAIPPACYDADSFCFPSGGAP